jgi:hypothetical protein
VIRWFASEAGGSPSIGAVSAYPVTRSIMRGSTA